MASDTVSLWACVWRLEGSKALREGRFQTSAGTSFLFSNSVYSAAARRGNSASGSPGRSYMSYTFRMVRSMRGAVPDIWASLVRARTFVVSPHQSLKIRLLGDSELYSGERVSARLAAGPVVLPEAWVVETHDRDEREVVLRGAEGFARRLLWDHEIHISESGPRCVVEYRVALPGRRRRLPLWIGVHHFLERRHHNLSCAIRAACPAEMHKVETAPRTKDLSSAFSAF